MRLRASKGWAVLALLASVGCGQTTAVSHTGSGGADANTEQPALALDFVQSGSRLTAIGYSSNEARLFRTFHDQELGFDCDFVPDAAGAQQRCVPSAEVPVVYTDAACSEPAAWVFERAGDATAVGEAVSGETSSAVCPGGAPPQREAYRISEQLTEEVLGQPPGLPLFEQRDGRCQTATIPAKVSPPVYRLVPLPEAELVRGERVSLDVGGGLRLTRLVSDDGAELTLGVTTADRTACEFQHDGECVAEPIARLPPSDSGRFYSALNADCTAPAYVAPYPTACGTPRFAVEDDHARPPLVRSLQRVSALFSLDITQPVTEPLTFSCNPHALSGSEQVSAPDRDVTGTLPTASRLRRGTGPLYVDWFSLGESELLPVQADWRRASPGVVPSGDFVDASGQVCLVTSADDGTLRCAVFDEQGVPVADPTTFPEVVLGPL